MDKKLRSFLPTEIRSIDKENLIIEHKINTKDLDRYLTVVLPKGVNAKHFAKNPVVLWFHNMKGDGIPIAKNVGMVIEEEHIIVKTKFNANNEFAMKVFQSFADGFLNTWSIGFMPTKYNRYTEENMDELNTKYNLKITKAQIKDASFWGVYVIYKWELLEYSAVPVPGNPGATTDNVKFAETLVSRGLTNKEEDINSFCVDLQNCKRTFGNEEPNEAHVSKIETQIKTLNEEDRKTEYDCECVDCDWETKSSKHCKDIKCEKCGGEMRRKDRPGSGKKDASTPTEDIKTDEISIEDKSKEVNVNGVLSSKILTTDKNRKVSSVIEEKLEEKEPEKKVALEEKVEAETVEDKKPEEKKEDVAKEEKPEEKKEDTSKVEEKTEAAPKEEKEVAPKEPTDIEKLTASVVALTATVDGLVKENAELKKTINKASETDNLDTIRALDEEQKEENKPQSKGFCGVLRDRNIVK